MRIYTLAKLLVMILLISIQQEMTTALILTAGPLSGVTTLSAVQNYLLFSETRFLT